MNDSERRQIILPAVLDYKLRLIAAHKKCKANDLIVRAVAEWFERHPEEFEEVPLAAMEIAKS